MKPLVGDEIQCREIKIGRGGDRAGTSVTLATCLMDLHLGARFHTVIVDLSSSDPQYTIRPLQTVEPRRDNLCNSPECDLVRNPCVRGGSQAN
jgi:hypothetical protein